MMDWLFATQDDVTNSFFGRIPVGQVIFFLVFSVGLTVWAWRQSKRTKPFVDFFRDWNGEPARPGVAKRPGVMERLADMNDSIASAPTRAEVTMLRVVLARVIAVIVMSHPEAKDLLKLDDDIDGAGGDNG